MEEKADVIVAVMTFVPIVLTMNKSDKILCCCSWGCNRSVHMKYVLNLGGYNRVLSLGLEKTDAETIATLCQWANVILVPEDRLRDCVPAEHRRKVRVLPIGEDRWGGWQRPELVKLIEECL